MYKDNQHSKEHYPEDAPASASLHHDTRDLFILSYIARKFFITLHTLEQPVTAGIPARYELKERHGRTHRLVIFNSQELLWNRNLSFVGFVSSQQRHIDPTIDNELQRMDEKMIGEITRLRSFLGYASLKLNNRHWYNLVLLNNVDVKPHLLNGEVHKYAAHQLAPHYYEWIRLHSGRICGGLDNGTFILEKTKYYTFPGGLHTLVEKVAVPEPCY